MATLKRSARGHAKTAVGKRKAARKVTPAITEGWDQETPEILTTEQEVERRNALLDDLVRKAVAAGQDVDKYLAIRDTIRKDLFDTLREFDRKEHVVPGLAKAQVVTPERQKIDAKKLKRKIGRQMWDKITDVVVNKGKLDQFVKAGDIDAVTVAECVDITEGTTHLRIDAKG